MRFPTEAEVLEVMRVTGMEYMQAYNHVKCKILAQSMATGLRR